MHTKPIREISLNSSEADVALAQIADESARNDMRKILQELLQELDILLKKEWVPFKNKSVFYHRELKALLPDLKAFSPKIFHTRYAFDNAVFRKTRFAGFYGRLMTVKEFRQAFARQGKKLKQQFTWKLPEFFAALDGELPCAYDGQGNLRAKFGSSENLPAAAIPIITFKSLQNRQANALDILLAWIAHELIPAGLSQKSETAYDTILSLRKKHGSIVYMQGDQLAFDELLLQDALLSDSIHLQKGKRPAVDELLKSKPLTLDSAKIGFFCEYLLYCDKMRCDLEEYDEKILSDPNRGHWDLWERDTGEYVASLENPLMARNPVADIRTDGVIGIDFGTKSTVVVYQEDSEFTLPMRIGTGQLGKEVEAKHFENPTVMEFIDLDSFMKSYQGAEGRPLTRWEQVTTSHTAYSSLLHSASQDYYSFLYELKQWAGDKQRRIRLRDKKGWDVVLPAFLDIEENSFNPIELYAYFIGLYINNMRNGIYLDYLLSFPVTYEKAVREKILDSFYRGIKKSLPPSLLKKEAIMESFRVSAGTSEPAAYAVCALQEYGFMPEGDEKVFYGVFDFGGGTTDFDFGVWREANRSERRYDYVVECFGAGGDKYLGGENLLELLAFEVFKDNQEALRKEKIPFVLPPECKKFPGGETILSDSQEAKINMTQLMEKLRPYWENHEGATKLFESGTLKVSLFDTVGAAKLNFELVIDVARLDEIIRKRIAKGIRNFFEGLRLAFAVPSTKAIKTVHIFLAGNSCKSPVVKELFAEFAQEESLKIDAADNDQDFFKLYPPLGSGEAVALQETLGVFQGEEEVALRPTCKTGVAYGLIASRPGGKIQLIQHNNTIQEGEIRFCYYIGYEQKKRFAYLSDRDIPYGEWQELVDAREVDFTLYYTDLPEASTNSMDIKRVQRKKCRLRQAYFDAHVYYRAVKPTLVEYVVARPEDLEDGKYLEDIVALELS